MSETGDLLFGKQLVAQNLVSNDTGAKLLQIQSILGQHQIQKSLADIVVEAGWLEKDRANAIINQINASQPDTHPGLNVAFSSPPLESAAQRAVQSGDIDRDRRQELAGLKTALEEFGYRRTLGELSYDQGLINARPATEDDRPRNAPDGGTARTRATGQATRPTRPQAGTSVKTPPPQQERRAPTGAKPGREGTRSTARPITANKPATAARQPATAVKPPTANKPSTAARTPTAIKPPSENKAATRQSTSARGRTSELRKAGVAIPPPPKKNLKVALISGIAVAAVGLVAVVALNSGKKPPVIESPTPTNVAVTKSIPSKTPVTTPSPTTTPIDRVRPTGSPAANPNGAEQDCDSYFFMAKSHAGAGKIDEALSVLERIMHDYPETRFYKENKAEIEELVAKLKKEKDEGDGPSKPTTEKKDLAALKAAWDKKRASRTAEGQKRVDEAVKAIEAERIAEENALASQLKRVADKKMSIRLKNDQQLDNIVIQKITRDSFQVKFNIDGGEVETEYPWDWVDDRSFLAMQRGMFGTDTAAGLYEVGRACILRKLWREAKGTFDAALKLDASLKDRIPDLSKIINNEAAFKGKAKNPMANLLEIKYDFADPEQSQDFSPRGTGPIDVAGGTATLNPRGSVALWSLKDVDYEGEVTLDAKVMLGAKSTFLIGTMFNWENKGFLLHIGPDGSSYYVVDGRIPREAKKKNDAGTVTGDATIKFKIKDGKISVTANGKEVFSVEDSTYTKGWILIGATGESVALKSLQISGKVNPTEIQKRFAESEVLVRRALENDLNAKERPQRPDDEEDALSVEDDYFMAQLNDEMREEFDDARKHIVKAQRRGTTVNQMRDCVSGLTKVIEAHPNFAAAYFWRSTANRMIREHEQSLKDLETAAAKEPDFFEARTHLAYHYYYEFKFAEADRYLSEALRIAPDDAEAVALRAEYRYTKRQDPKLWKLEFETAVKLEPDSQQIRTRYRNLINEFKGPENLGCKHKIETKHFTVMTDITPAATKLYGDRLEAAFRYYADTFKEFFTDDLTRPRARIAIFNTREAYFTYAELTSSDRKENTLGYFSPLNNELLLFEDVDLDETLHTLYHELFHKFMSLMIPRAPYWYNEGIAEYMGAIKIDKGVVVAKAQMLDGRIKSMKPHLNMALKFEQIMKQTPGEFYSGPVSFKYAQVWSMIHFFYEYQGGKYRSLIDSYYRNLLHGKSMNEAYEEVFAKVDIDELQKEWRGFAQGLEPSKP